MTAITITLETDDSLTELAQELQEFFPKRVFRRITREVIPENERLLDRLIDTKLRPYPPRRNRNSPRFRWSDNPEKNAAARRWFFRNHPNGYTRTGALGRAWRGEIAFDKGTVTIGVENPSKAASYVYGSEPYGYRQVPGHVVTGWQNAGKTAEPIVIEVAVSVNDGVERVLVEELERL